MRIPPVGYLTLALLCAELACVVTWAFTETFPVLNVGCVLVAMRWED